MDFTPYANRGEPTADASAHLTALLDASIVAKRAAEPKRDYLGGSRLGEECERLLGYEYAHAEPDDGRGFSGQAYRIFDRGHRFEDMMAGWLRDAGFLLITEKEGGGQIGWGVARDLDTGKHRIAGHLDGVIIDWSPNDYSDITAQKWARWLSYPLLWEMKALNAKNWAGLSKGLRAAKPIYYAQCQVYMAYKDLKNALFTAVNADTCQVYAEVVPFDMDAAQAASDRGVRVIQARTPEELPRIAASPTDWRCRFCDFQGRCWKPDAPAPEAQKVSAPSWGAWS